MAPGVEQMDQNTPWGAGAATGVAAREKSGITNVPSDLAATPWSPDMLLAATHPEATKSSTSAEWNPYAEATAPSAKMVGEMERARPSSAGSGPSRAPDEDSELVHRISATVAAMLRDNPRSPPPMYHDDGRP